MEFEQNNLFVLIVDWQHIHDQKANTTTKKQYENRPLCVMVLTSSKVNNICFGYIRFSLIDMDN